MLIQKENEYEALAKTAYDEKDHAWSLLPILLGMFGERVQRTERTDSFPNHSGRGRKAGAC
jgi:hypothetical protein